MAREKRDKLEEDEGDPNAWMATFSDLVTLLITFFVLILSMSSLDAKSMDDTFGFFNGRLGALGMAVEPTSRVNSVNAPHAPIIPSLKNRTGTPRNVIRFESEPDELFADDSEAQQKLKLSDEVLRALESAQKKTMDDKVDELLPFGTGSASRERFESVVSILKQDRFKNLFEVKVEQDKMIIYFAGDLLFHERRVRIHDQSLVLLREIAQVLTRSGLEARVMGVVSNETEPPARQDLYPTNWELAIARGCNVVRYLVHNAKVPAGLMSCAVLPPAAADKRALMSGVIFEIKAKNR